MKPIRPTPSSAPKNSFTLLPPLLDGLESRGFTLLEKLFCIRSRYLVLFLTLNYSPSHRENMDYSNLCRHRDHLLNNIPANPLLRGIQAYIWRIEEGGKAGLHLHLLLFYSGESRSDINIARSIGEYWINVITRGAGSYWNSNAHKERLILRGCPVGLGQINRGNESQQDAVRRIITYMAKTGQEAHQRPRHGRQYGTSALPKIH